MVFGKPTIQSGSGRWKYRSNAGLGVASPTAVYIEAGTASAGTAPINRGMARCFQTLKKNSSKSITVFYATGWYNRRFVPLVKPGGSVLNADFTLGE